MNVLAARPAAPAAGPALPRRAAPACSLGGSAPHPTLQIPRLATLHQLRRAGAASGADPGPMVLEPLPVDVPRKCPFLRLAAEVAKGREDLRSWERMALALAVLTEQINGGAPVIDPDFEYALFSQSAAAVVVTAALLAPAVLRGPKDVGEALGALDRGVAAERTVALEAAALLLSNWRGFFAPSSRFPTSASAAAAPEGETSPSGLLALFPASLFPFAAGSGARRGQQQPGVSEAELDRVFRNLDL